MKVIVSDIKYDTDGEDIKLPTTLGIDIPNDITDPYEQVDYISDKISDITGFCHMGFTTDPIINK